MPHVHDNRAFQARFDPQERIPSGYEPIHLAALRLAGRWDLDLFVVASDGEPPVLLRDAQLGVKDKRIERLVQTLDRRVLVRAADYWDLSAGLLANLDAIQDDRLASPADKFAMFQMAAAAGINEAYARIDPDGCADFAVKMGRRLVALLQTGALLPAEVFAVARHDSAVFTHATNVCCYVILLAEQMGISGSGQLNQIAVGAMLHDVGKRRIPVDLIRKRTRLNRKEQATYQSHAKFGFEDLLHRVDLSLEQLLMGYQHHEQVDGGGYPVGLSAEEIHPWARLLAVVNRFDNLTARSAAGPGYAPEVAMEQLQRDAGTLLEEEAVQCWSQVLPTR